MKKNLFMVAAVALLALVSCNKEEINNGGVEPQEPQAPSVTVEFTASLEEGTKTTLDAANRKTLWVDSDRISINGQEFEIKEIQEDGKAIFKNVNDLPEDFAAPFTAIYPYGSNGVPASQTAYANNFDPAAVIETATSEDYSLHFSNESSLLKFQVPANCSSVTLSATENLAEDSNTVTISGSMEADTDYYVAVLPGTKTNFVVRIDGYLSKNANSVTIGESAIINMKSLPAPVKSSWGVIGLNGDWNNDIAMYDDLNGYSVAKNVTIKSTDEFKFRVGQWENEVSGGLTAPDTKRTNNTTIKANITISKAGTYDIYTNGTEYYIMTPGRMPSTASAPSDITITISSIDKNYKCLYMWGAVSVNCKYSSNSTWSVTIPADKLDERVKAILTKGTSDGKWDWQTNDSDDLCLRNPMPLKVVDNKATH